MANGITFGAWLKQRRNDLGLTQEELAENIHCSFSTLRKLKGDERRPSGQVAELIASYINIPADEQEAFVAFARRGGSISSPGEGLPADVEASTPWRAARGRLTNLPSRLTPLIGREHQQAIL